MTGRHRIQHGFSLVEIVIGLTIMSVLVGVTVTTYSDSAQRAREQVAQDEARAIASSIQRWQLENQRPYPFKNVLPLVPRYLKNVSSDPWTAQYNVDTVQKIVYSFGPDGQDDKGAGDDVSYFYDTSGDVAPGPPQGLTVRKEAGNVRVNFSPPVRNADGSKPVDDLDKYIVYIRSSKETKVNTFFEIDPHTLMGPGGVVEPDATITGLYGANALDESYYFTARAVDEAGNISGPSNQAGLFVSKDVAPRIVLFKASSNTPAVSSAFSFFIEVIDADSNLEEVRIKNFLKSGGDTVFTTASGDITNPFRFVKNWAPAISEMSPRVIPSVTLEAKDPNTTTSTSIGPIEFLNRAPLITSLTPGVKLLTRNPAVPPPGEVVVNFTIEAADQEANMTALTLQLWRVSGAPTMLASQNFPLNPQGAVMIRNWSYPFDIYTVAEYELRVTATDVASEVSLQRTARIIVKDDTTPPDAMVVSLDPSNPLQRDSEYAGVWWNPSTTSIRVYMEAFEIESPPVTYQVKITERPFGPSWEVPPGDSVTYGQGTSAAAGWYDIPFPYSPYTAQDFKLELAANKGLQLLFDQTKTYSLGMRATNSVGLVNITTAEPFHLASLTPQNPFRVDIDPPDICSTCIEILGNSATGFVWVQDLLSAEWDVSDYVLNNPVNGTGSGDNLYRYRIWRWNSSGLSREATPIYDWTEVATKQINSVVLPIPNLTYNGRIWELEVSARDLAGNWMTVPQTAFAKMDVEPPIWTGARPTITNLVGGVVPVLDTFSANWLGVLQDPQSGIESYEWGISTTEFLAANSVPDVFGWLPVVGSAFTSGTISLNNLLTEGDNVRAVVRARNFAGSLSQTVASTAALVSVSLFTNFEATPRTGLSPLSVNFTGSVSGGDPPFDYRFQFDGTSLKEFAVYGTSQTEISTSFDYDLSDLSLPRPEILARLIIQDNSGRVSKKDLIIDLRDDLVAGISFDDRDVLYFISVNGAGTVTPLFSVKDPKLSSPQGWGQMFIEPQGQFVVGMPRMATGTSSTDEVHHAVIDAPATGAQHIRINTIKGTAGAAGPELSTMTFTPNVPRGTLVQTFNQRIGNDAIPCITKGMIRAMTIDRSPTEVVSADLEFGCDDAAVTPITYWGGVADPNDISVGMAIYQGPPPIASTEFYAKRFDGVGTYPDMVTGFANDSSPETTSFTDNGELIGAVPSVEPSPRVYPVATSSGYYLVANNRASPQNRILRMVKTSTGFGKMDHISPDTGTTKNPGLLDVTSDGLVYATILSDGGTGANWSVGMGYVTSPTYTVPIFTGAGNARNLDIDDGGTRVAVVSDNGNVYIHPVINLDTKPEADGGGVVTVTAASDITVLNNGSSPAAGGKPSAVRFFRRPNNGQPRVTGVFSYLDDSVNGDGTAMSGDVITTDNENKVVVKGVNLDKVQANTIEIVVDGDTCGPMSPNTVLDLPPLSPFGGYTAYLPSGGDNYHYMIVDLDQVCLEGVTSVGTFLAQLRVETPLGTSASVTTTNFLLTLD